MSTRSRPLAVEEICKHGDAGDARNAPRWQTAAPARPAPDHRLAGARTTASIPRIDLASWKLHVWGLVEEEKTFTWDEFNALGNATELNDIHCVTTWSKYDNTWEGVPFKALMDNIQLKPEAKFAMIHSYGGYTTNVPLEDLMREGVMFVRKHDGEELTKEHGWPMRLVVPTSTSGRARSGLAASSSSTATGPGSGKRTATTSTETRGAKSATAHIPVTETSLHVPVVFWIRPGAQVNP